MWKLPAKQISGRAHAQETTMSPLAAGTLSLCCGAAAAGCGSARKAGRALGAPGTT